MALARIDATNRQRMIAAQAQLLGQSQHAWQHFGLCSTREYLDDPGRERRASSWQLPLSQIREMDCTVMAASYVMPLAAPANLTTLRRPGVACTLLAEAVRKPGDHKGAYSGRCCGTARLRIISAKAATPCAVNAYGE